MFLFTYIFSNGEPEPDKAKIVKYTTYVSNNQVVDVLISHISTMFRSRPQWGPAGKSVFLDTRFVSQLSKLYTKFSRTNRKDNFRFSATVVEMLKQAPSYPAAVRFYFPFNLDQKYWVGICVDCSSWSVYVLDTNNTVRTDNHMEKEIKPVAEMLKYLLKQAGRQFVSRDGKKNVH